MTGRKPAKIDEAQVIKLAQRFWSKREIAAFFGVSEDTIHRRFSTSIQRGRAIGSAGLREIQFKLAMQGNERMLIWLGKQYLGQNDRPQLEVESLETQEDSEAIEATIRRIELMAAELRSSPINAVYVSSKSKSL